MSTVKRNILVYNSLVVRTVVKLRASDVHRKEVKYIQVGEGKKAETSLVKMTGKSYSKSMPPYLQILPIRLEIAVIAFVPEVE